MGGSESTVQSMCDVVAPMDSFDAARYMGDWYVIQKSSGAAYDSSFFYASRANYHDLNAETGAFEIDNTSSVWPLGFDFTASGKGIHNGGGQIRVGISGSPPSEPNYRVMDTDYDTYTIVYNCDFDKPGYVANLWIMARETSISRELHIELLEWLIPRLENYDWSIAMLETQK